MVVSQKSLDNLKKGKATRFVAGDSQVEIARKGQKASTEAKRKNRSMREWVELFGNLPMKGGDLSDPTKAEDIKDANLTMDGELARTIYDHALAGDPRFADMLIKLKGQYAPSEIKITTEVEDMSESDLDRLIAQMETKEEPKKAVSRKKKTEVKEDGQRRHPSACTEGKA